MPPADPPRASRSKPRRKPRQATQPPSSTARQNAAFGSRKARPLPKPKPAPVAQPRRGATPAPVRVVQRAARAQKPAPVPKPSAARQARNARAQQAGYVSQGKAVEKAAAQQRRVAQARAIAALPSRGGGGGDFDASLAPTRNRPAADAAAAVASKRIGHRIYLGGDNHYYAHVKRTGLPDRHIPVDPFTGKADKRYQSDPRSGGVEAASVNAPALKVLDQTTRPLHAIQAQNVAAIKRGGLKEAFIGVHAPGSKEAKQSRRAFKRGLELKDRSLGSDVLKAAGVKNKGVAAAGGFVTDLLADPFSYVTGGTGSVAERLALKAGRKATRKAVRAGIPDAAAATARKSQAKVAADAAKQAARKGATPKQAAKAGKRAGEQHVRSAEEAAIDRFAAPARRRATSTAPAGRGVTLKVGGVEVPVVRRATAKVARGVRKGTRRVVGKNVSETVPAIARAAVREVAPRVAPSSALRDAHIIGRAESRRARASTQHGAERAASFERTIKEQIPDKADRDLVVAALDRGNLSHIMGPEYRQALRKTGGDKRKALALVEKANPKEFQRRQSLARLADDLRTEFGTVHQRAVRAGAQQKPRPGEFLNKTDLRKLNQTIVGEQAHRQDVVDRLAGREVKARERALLTEQEATLRHQGAQKVSEAVATGRARVEQAQLAGRARVATEKVRGSEQVRVARERERGARVARVATEKVKGRAGTVAAVSRQQAIARTRAAVVEADRRLKAELAKPILKRKGVAVLEAKVGAARGAWQEAKRPVTAMRALAVRPRPEPAAPVSALRPRVQVPVVERAARTVGPREGRAAERYSGRSADVAAAEAQLKAAHNIPVQRVGESHEAYLHRVRQHAISNGLTRVRRKTETLLAKKPTQVARGYYPRETATRASGGGRGFAERVSGVAPEGRRGSGRVVSQTTAGRRRVADKSLDAVNAERIARGDEPYSKDLPLVAGNHLRQAARATSQGEFAQHMAKAVGRPVARTEDLREGEDLYKLGFDGGRFGLHRVSSQKVPRAQDLKPGETVVAPRTEHLATPGPREIARAAKEGKPVPQPKVIRAPGLQARRVPKDIAAKGTGGQYVAMPRGLFEQMERSTKGTASDNPLLMIFDRAQGGWKRAAITSLAFHIRNLIGDIQAGYYLPGAGGSLRNIPQASRAVARHSQQARMLRAPASHATMTWGGKKGQLDDFLKLGLDNGVLDTGIVAREVLDDTTGAADRLRAKGASTRGGRVLRRGSRAVNRWVTNRENVMRLAAFKTGLDRGMLPHEAADMANLFHIDYGELSSSERAFFRRAMPFYTWTARSLPVAALTMIQRPGKFANLEALREETGAGFTGQPELEQRAAMPASVRRQVPFTIRVAGSNYAVSASLPLTLLNEFPGGGSKKDLSAWMDELGHFGISMIGPNLGAKPAIERSLNVNSFTRQPIHDPHHPLVPGPAWLKLAPDWVKHMTGATMIVNPDDKTGPKIWGWRGTADWTSRQLSVGIAGQASAAAGGGRPGQEPLSTAAALGTAFSGVRVDKLGRPAATRAQTQKLRDELAKLDERATILNQQGITKANATPEYKALRKRINDIDHILKPLKGKRKSAGGNPLLKTQSSGGGNPLLKSSGGGGTNPLLKGGS